MNTPPTFTDPSSTEDFRLEPGQDIVLVDSEGREALRIDANGIVTLLATNGDPVLRLEGRQGNLSLGGNGIDGDLLLFTSTGDVTAAGVTASIRLNGQRAQMSLGAGSTAGALEVSGPDQQVRIDGSAGRMQASGSIEIRSEDGAARVRILPNASILAGGDGEAGVVRLKSGQGRDRVVLNGQSANGEIGGEGEDGVLRILNAVGEVTLLLNGGTGNLAVGGNDEHGAIFVKAGTGSDADNVFVLNGERGDVILGSNGRGSDVSIRDDTGQETLLLRGKTGNIAAGRNGQSGNLFIKNDLGLNAIHLSGETGNANITGNVNVDGDIRLANADCAEEFSVAVPWVAGPGTVMSLEDNGSVAPCCHAYDTRVVGVVSGAGRYRPAIILDSTSGPEPRTALALSGKIYCRVEAESAEVAVGDLLTTSDIIGHARRATDAERAFGAVLGKAMEPLAEGRGLIRVLVCLA
jgi:hypothetical protein